MHVDKDFREVTKRKLSDRQIFLDKGEVLKRDLFIIDVIAKGVIMIFNKYDDREKLEYTFKEYSHLALEDCISRLNFLHTNKVARYCWY